MCLIPYDNENPFAGDKPERMSYFEYLMKSTRQDVVVMRDYWNDLYRRCKLPIDVKNDIMRRFASKGTGIHMGTLFELFIYEYLTITGNSVSAGPELAGGKPDFQLRTPNDEEFCMETTCVMGDSWASSKQQEEEVKLVLTDKQIRNKLKDKSKQIRGSNLPVVITINVLNWIMDREDVLNALFGPIQAVIDISGGKPRVEKMIRGPIGAWIADNRPQKKTIQSVLFFWNVNHDAVPRKKPMLTINPCVKHPVYPRNLKFVDYYMPTATGITLLPPEGKSAPASSADWRDHWPMNPLGRRYDP